jgi:uncharacterized membrane protein
MKRSHLAIFSASFGAIMAGFVMTLYLWNSLPDKIPTHFGISGTPDAWSSKSPLALLMIPLIGLAIFALLSVLYKYPQYSSWPTTLILMTIEENKREKIFHVYREMMAFTLFAISLMFAYIQFTILATANGRANGVDPLIMAAFLAVIITLLIYINVRMFITIRRLVKKQNK